MNRIVLHISDLHVSLNKVLGGGAAKVNYSLTTSSETESAFGYIEKFTKIIKNDYLDAKIYLLITGDITNAGEVKEFEFATKYILRIIEDLNIDKNNILLIPGDHDLNRRELQSFYAEHDTPSKESVNNAKYANFAKFYKELLDKNFDPNKVIFDTLVVEDKILLLGLNSCIDIDLQQLDGSISIADFEEEYKSIPIEGKKVIACTHHNMTSAFDNRHGGQWLLENRKRVVSKLTQYDINYIFCGNEHICSSRPISSAEITVSDSGCLTALDDDATFKIYPIEINDDIILKNKIYGLLKIKDNDFGDEWDIRRNSSIHQKEEYIIFQKDPPAMEAEIIEIMGEDILSLDDSLELQISSAESVSDLIYYNPEFTDILYDKVKELKIFHTGHYHYSETSRTHNWIDVSKLIENRNNLNFIKNAIVDVLEKKIGENNVDMIIGLGYEGNVISTKAAIKYNKPYTFLPYSYRHDEHHESERLLNFENNGLYKNVLIVTDVVNDGRTIRKLIRKRQDDFFQKVDKIFVISLFYTGTHHINSHILNYSFLESLDGYDLSTDEVVNKIEFYSVKSLKVEKCPYGKDFREKCFIYSDELSCVNLFYDETKYVAQ
ncbi:hypothetical protein AAW12_24460 [Sphingobacterium sp. Ag1]|uniref:metallophosphoesterase n=1 Tax=Sphingobacterium sp. Ag1 TaxID=1643451 RepID=UPI0006279BF7|nr:metallophosphoesterase [Sphingobacterium sp. Ag1]KKO89259.1 hypothetical protein AAW12_24460 [Sphingobacterium sp. Ag1]